MIGQRLIAALMLIYLLWRSGQALRDFLKGEVLKRNSWVAPRWPLPKTEPRFGTKVYSRRTDPVAYWCWTLGQALFLMFLIALFTIVLVKP